MPAIAAHAAHLFRWLTTFHTFHQDQRGQGLVEYALIMVFVSIVSIAVLTTLGHNLANAFTQAAGAFASPTPTP